MKLIMSFVMHFHVMTTIINEAFCGLTYKSNIWIQDMTSQATAKKKIEKQAVPIFEVSL